MYSKEIVIRFRESDPAGIMWFGHILEYCHDTFEDFIVNCGISWQDWFSQSPYLVPIRHVAVDFLSPFLAGQKYQVIAGVKSFSKSSFTMQYEFKGLNTTHAQVTMVHTFLDQKTKQKISIPQEIQSKLEKFVWESK
jgi:acyl-CoA thioesterase FadM